MESKNRGFRYIISIVLLFSCFASRTKAAFNPESFQRKLVALYKILDYILDRPQQMNIDVTFGITLTEANLAVALFHKNARYLENKYFNILKEVVMLCDITRKHLMNIVTSKNEDEFLLQLILNDPNLWIRPISWRWMFPKMISKWNSQLSYTEIVNSMWHGTPNETESDQCLFEIARSTLNGKCQIPETCIETLFNDNDPAGYPLTHRLLIVQIAKALGCPNSKTMSFSYLTSIYCARILQDLVNLEEWNFPNVAPDLMSEQIVLCGMEGFYEFTDKHYENLILSWPHQSGCFSAFGFSKKHKITRRSSSTIDFECNNHATALAAASLSVFIRQNVENLFNAS